MNDFPKIYKLPTLNDKQLENLNRLINSEEIETTIRNFSKNKSPRPDGSVTEFYQTFKEDWKPILLKLFQKIEEDAILSNTFYEDNIILIPKPVKENSKKQTSKNNPPKKTTD